MISVEKLETELREAMRTGDEVRKRTLRMALSSLKLAAIDKGKPLDEPTILALLQKEIKTRHESIADANQAKRVDLIADIEAEIRVLEGFLPIPLTTEELENFVRIAINEIGATTIRDMGKVMKVLMPRLSGRAEGSTVSKIVQKLLG